MSEAEQLRRSAARRRLVGHRRRDGERCGQGHRVALLEPRRARRRLAAELGERALAIEADVTDRDSLVAARAGKDSSARGILSTTPA